MWQTLIPVLAALAGGIFGRSTAGSSSGGVSGGALDPQMMEMLNEQRMRMRLQNPLYEEATQLARALMPKSAKPASYVLPNQIMSEPAPLPDTNPTPPDPNVPQPQGQDDALSRAVRMMASGIAPIEQAKLFRRRG